MTDGVLLNGITPENTLKWIKAQQIVGHRPCITYLDHEHRKGENIRFFAMWPFVQDLWRSPSRGVNVLTRDTLSGPSQAKLRGAPAP